MKVNNSVKEKAMVKLKEIKSKSDDTGSKARQYLEGLLKIPFGYYVREDVMEYVPSTISLYNKIVDMVKSDTSLDEISTLVELQVNISKINEIVQLNDKKYYDIVLSNFTKGNKSQLTKKIISINNFVKKINTSCKKITYAGKTVDTLRESIKYFINNLTKNENIWKEFLNNFENNIYKEKTFINNSINSINSNLNSIQNYMKYIDDTLNTSVYGHEKAKQQIKRIIGQWISGENSGYCFGFEGPPGVGKTSLAKNGIANCLKDSDNNSRPFSFVAIGGSSNGSTFEGHNYTYVGSNMGKNSRYIDGK